MFGLVWLNAADTTVFGLVLLNAAGTTVFGLVWLNAAIDLVVSNLDVSQCVFSTICLRRSSHVAIVVSWSGGLNSSLEASCRLTEVV